MHGLEQHYSLSNQVSWQYDNELPASQSRKRTAVITCVAGGALVRVLAPKKNTKMCTKILTKTWVD
jgi:hypothetical protein